MIGTIRRRHTIVKCDWSLDVCSFGRTATAGSDYTALSGTVTIAAGSTTADIDVAVLDDVMVEVTQTVVVTLQSISSGNPGITVDAFNAATVNIADNDTATVELNNTSVNSKHTSNA